MLYLAAEPFDPDADADLVSKAMTHPTVHKGEIGEVCVAFARKGHGLPWMRSSKCSKPDETCGNSLRRGGALQRYQAPR